MTQYAPPHGAVLEWQRFDTPNMALGDPRQLRIFFGTLIRKAQEAVTRASNWSATAIVSEGQSQTRGWDSQQRTSGV